MFVGEDLRAVLRRTYALVGETGTMNLPTRVKNVTTERWGRLSTNAFPFRGSPFSLKWSLEWLDTGYVSLP